MLEYLHETTLPSLLKTCEKVRNQKKKVKLKPEKRQNWFFQFSIMIIFLDNHFFFAMSNFSFFSRHYMIHLKKRITVHMCTYENIKLYYKKIFRWKVIIFTPSISKTDRSRKSVFSATKCIFKEIEKKTEIRNNYF